MKLVFALLFSAAVVGGTLGLFSAKADATNYYTGISWQSSTVNWCFTSSLPSYVQNQWNWATITWSSPSDWFLAYSSTCNAKIGFAEESFSQSGQPNYPGRNWVYSIGQYAFLSISYLNTDYSWSAVLANGVSMYDEGTGTFCPYTCDYRTVQVHEIGHAVSFAEVSYVPGSGCPSSTVMCADVVKRSLKTHDITSLQWVY